ncbi:MAG: hypothetical protein RL674_1528, partial [Pseudomonadota bacterium]
MNIKTAQPVISREDYFALDNHSNEKHELYQGEIFAMSRGTFNHATIGANVVTELKIKLR